MKEGDAVPRKGLRLWEPSTARPSCLILHEGELATGSDRAADLPVWRPAYRAGTPCCACGTGSVTVRDLGSKNGTFVNGLRIEKSRLAPGDWLQLGPSSSSSRRRTLVTSCSGSRADVAEAPTRVTPSEIDTWTSVQGTHEVPSGWLETLEKVLDILEEQRPGLPSRGARPARSASWRHRQRYHRASPGSRACRPRGRWRVRRPRGCSIARGTKAGHSAEMPGPDDDALPPFRRRRLPWAGLLCGPPALRHPAPRRIRPAPHPRPMARPTRLVTELRHPPGAVVRASPAACAWAARDRRARRQRTPSPPRRETGVGKEIIARTLHLSSPRSGGPSSL